MDSDKLNLCPEYLKNEEKKLKAFKIGLVFLLVSFLSWCGYFHFQFWKDSKTQLEEISSIEKMRYLEGPPSLALEDLSPDSAPLIWSSNRKHKIEKKCLIESPYCKAQDLLIEVDIKSAVCYAMPIMECKRRKKLLTEEVFVAHTKIGSQYFLSEIKSTNNQILVNYKESSEFLNKAVNQEVGKLDYFMINNDLKERFITINSKGGLKSELNSNLISISFLHSIFLFILLKQGYKKYKVLKKLKGPLRAVSD